MRTTALRRSLAAGASAAIAVAGLAAFAPAANAASANITFNCKLLGGLVSSDFVTTADTDLPASVNLGSTTPVGFKSTITVPAATADIARGLGNSVAGTAKIAATVDGAAAPATAPVPSTALGAAGTPLVLSISGTGTSYVASTVGKKTVKVPSYTAALVFSGGATPTNVDVTCTAATGADTTVDTFDVVDPAAPAPVVQTTKIKSSSVYKAGAKKLVAKVEVKNADGTAAAGDLKLVLKMGNKKVGKAVTVTLNKKGKAKNAFQKVTAKGKYTLKVNYKGSDVSEKSNKTFTIKVK